MNQLQLSLVKEFCVLLAVKEMNTLGKDLTNLRTHLWSLYHDMHAPVCQLHLESSCSFFWWYHTRVRNNHLI